MYLRPDPVPHVFPKPRESESEPESEPEASTEEQDLARTIGVNLRRLRTQRHLSLEALARKSGVSRAMLGQIELGRSTPTIALMWKVARALAVPLSTFLSREMAAGPFVIHAAETKILASRDGKFVSRALFPFGVPRTTEFYELRLAGGAHEHAEAHSAGTVENIVVTEGIVEIIVGGSRHLLGPGDAIQFEADVPHEYRNTVMRDAIMYLVMTYAVSIG